MAFWDKGRRIGMIAEEKKIIFHRKKSLKTERIAWTIFNVSREHGKTCNMLTWLHPTLIISLQNKKSIQDSIYCSYTVYFLNLHLPLLSSSSKFVLSRMFTYLPNKISICRGRRSITSKVKNLPKKLLSKRQLLAVSAHISLSLESSFRQRTCYRRSSPLLLDMKAPLFYIQKKGTDRRLLQSRKRKKNQLDVRLR